MFARIVYQGDTSTADVAILTFLEGGQEEYDVAMEDSDRLIHKVRTMIHGLGIRSEYIPKTYVQFDLSSQNAINQLENKPEQSNKITVYQGTLAECINRVQSEPVVNPFEYIHTVHERSSYPISSSRLATVWTKHFCS